MKTEFDAETDDTIVQQIHEIVRAIPSGKVSSYGAVGAGSTPAISGYICGRIMQNVPSDVPWWRVVGKDGNLPIRKRHPELSIEQREKLEAEGVEFENEKVVMEKFSAPSKPGTLNRQLCGAKKREASSNP